MKTSRFPLMIIIPVLAWFIIFFFYPFINSIRVSAYEWNIIDPVGSPFVGLSNFRELFQDRVFITSLWNTIKFVILRVLIGIPIGLFVSVLLEKIGVLRNMFLGFIFAPYAVSITAISVLFRWLFQPRFGLVNTVLKIVGLPAQKFISDPTQAIYVYAAVDIWQSIGYSVILFLAGLLEIPKDFTEAAILDGANGWKIFWKIKLPLLSNVSLFVFITTLIGAFQIFERMAVFTGNPNDARASQYVLSFYIYRLSIHHMRMGYACAAAIVMFLIVFVFTLIQLKVLRKKWEY